jgi:PleD family two-component response regulator
MFTIELPWLPQVETKRSIRPAPKAPEASDGLRILVVEDDPDVGAMLGELLTGQGHDVMAAPDGPAALDLIAHGVPDLVIADYNLPNGPNGLEPGHPLPLLQVGVRQK